MSEILSTLYPWVKTLHIISVISWMAGMFYLPRLFVYHTEKASDDPKLALIYQEMEYKLLKVIINPAMIATWFFGLCLVFTPGIIDWSQIWPWVKAIMVISMSGFHGWASKHRKLLAAGDFSKSGKYYRLMNEVPTVLMIIIVVMVIVRPF